MSEPLRFTAVHEPDEAAPPVGAATGMLVLALRALSQRAIVAIDNLFMVATVGSAWYLWFMTPDPNPMQLVGLGGYAVFVLLANWIARRSK
jgi:hypothetical protein